MKRVVLGCLLFLSLVGVILYHRYTESQKEVVEKEVIYVESEGVVPWLEYFSKRQFMYCDLMLDNANDGLYNTKVYYGVNDMRYYDALLEALVNCISDIQSDPIESEPNKYLVTITFTPYEQVYNVVYTFDMFEDVKDQYLNEQITETEFQQKLSELYWKIYADSCFTENKNGVVKTLECVLYERVNGGSTRVYGTVEFVDMLLKESNLLGNIEVYEKEVKRAVELILEYE